MAHWSLDDIPWHSFNPALATPEMISLIKAASMVEHNGHDYARYLQEVFSGDEEFQQAAREWAEEEVQHGRALRKWAELADPAFDFDKSFKTFTTGYSLPTQVVKSVRGSRCGELVARCMVEIGTSSLYTAFKDSSDEPVLKAVCGKIAADEFRHYKLFYTHLQRYLEKENLGSLKRLKVLLGRIAESEDDELAYAYYAAQNPGPQDRYDRKTCAGRCMAMAGKHYRKTHVERAVMMSLKTVGLNPPALFSRGISFLAWNFLQARVALCTFRLKPQKLAA